MPLAASRVPGRHQHMGKHSAAAERQERPQSDLVVSGMSTEELQHYAHTNSLVPVGRRW
jgi:hypothetical protein